MDAVFALRNKGAMKRTALMLARKRLGVTQEVIAERMGVSVAQISRWESGKDGIPSQRLASLSTAYEGSLNQLLGPEELRSNAVLVGLEGAALEDARDDLEVWGTGLGAAREVDGEAIEQTTLNTGEIVEYVARPSILKRKQVAYALYVQGSSMHPALPEGEMAVAAKDMPLKAGDNVVVYLRIGDPEYDDGETARAVLVKEFIRRSASFVELRQYQPYKEFRIDMKEVLRIDRILTRAEMLQTR